MKKQKKRDTKSEIERQYLTVFSPHALPFRGANEESLEQPSALKYVQTTATPQAEVRTA